MSQVGRGDSEVVESANLRNARIASALAWASFLSEQGKAHPAPVRITSMVLQTSTPDARSMAASIVTSAMSESGTSDGFRCQKRSLRCSVARSASLLSVSVVEPDRRTSRCAVCSAIGNSLPPQNAVISSATPSAMNTSTTAG
jgi:hypothetical protein